MNIDILATIYNNDGEYDDEGNVITSPTVISGFHVNTTEPLPNAEEFIIVPTQPRRIFSGLPTICYKFDSEEQAQEYLPQVEEQENLGE